MATAYYVFMVTTACPECGEPLMLDAPTLRVTCRACRSEIDVPAGEWQTVFSFPPEMQPKLQLAEGQLRTSATLGREFSMRVRWGPARPLCACGKLLDLTRCPPGTSGEVPCSCGRSVTTYPAPSWLAEVAPDATQVWLAAQDRRAAPQLGVGEGRKPISFSCPECGANLKITAESTRLLECEFCKCDLFLPDALWFAIHPVRTRQRWYVSFVSDDD